MFDPTAVTLPLSPYKVTPNGEYRWVRRTKDGGTRLHYGLDMRPLVERAWCVAPERAVVRYVDRDASADATPLGGYGPGALILDGALGYYHVLAHLEPDSIPSHLVPGAVVRCGERVGRIAPSTASEPNLNHVHWEVRRAVTPPAGVARGEYVIDPRRWLAMRQLGAVGAVGAALVALPLALVVGLGVVAGVTSGVTRGGERSDWWAA